jgi:hypothetical protein
MIDYQKFESDWAAYQLRLEATNATNLTVIMEALAKLGIESVEVTFDGYGDSGQVEDITCEGGAGKLDGVTVTVETTLFCGNTETSERPLQEAVEQLCYGLLESEHCGWEDNDGAFGTFTFEVPARKVHLKFNGRFIAHETFSHSFPEEA